MSETRERGTPYKVPSLMNPRRTVTAIDCTGCGKQVRMGAHSKASTARMLALVGTRCDECVSAAADDAGRA